MNPAALLPNLVVAPPVAALLLNLVVTLPVALSAELRGVDVWCFVFHEIRAALFLAAEAQFLIPADATQCM